MHSKCLKFQLVFLFLLTTISFVFFYYQDRLPDNMFIITSNTESDSFLLYHIYSFIALTGHYSGPWIFFPFFSFALFYAFVYSKRNYIMDIFNIFLLIALFMVWVFIAKPVFLGQGLHYLISQYVPRPVLFLAAVVLPVAFLFGTFRSSLKSTLLDTGRFITSMFFMILNIRKIFVPGNITGGVKSGYHRLFSSSRIKLHSLLRHEDNNKPLLDQEAPDSEAESRVQAPSSENNTANKEPKKKMIDEKAYQKIVATLKLNNKKQTQDPPHDSYFQGTVERIEDKLLEFNIEGVIDNISKGPVVDTFELKLGAGIRVSKIRGIAEDLSMALMGVPIRIVHPIPGKETVGIEVPRHPREMIYLDEVLSSQEYRNATFQLPIAMGKDAFGTTFVTDLASMPHMLVAGATGAGKSVFINTILVSLLMKKSPRTMQLILIDPKQLELALYARLPHLAVPVLTDARKASLALLWACHEMERRYTLLREHGVRNIDGLNQGPGRSQQVEQLPHLVIIIDEFADLILTKFGKEIENNICRLAAKARAAGIHLVLATQRPSVDVITGLIKSNFPTRVSFRVTSPVDSRTILSMQGAELLLGKGDMLYKHGIATTRVHSSYIDENEIDILTTKLSEAGGSFHSEAMDFLKNEQAADRRFQDMGGVSPQSWNRPSFDESSESELYQQAVKIVTETKVASASFLQRKLKIGYNKAATLLEMMEEEGFVGPPDGSKRRSVLSDSDLK